MKPFSILQISDLHRSPQAPLTNAELISALVEDRNRYIHEEPKITVPEAIVVCGDIIQGVPIGTNDYINQLKQQYTIAEEFLGELTNRFLDGDRSRIVIVPGNHDIDWNTAQKAFEPVDPKNIPQNLSSELYSDQSDYRLDWKSLTLLRIADRDLYEQRFDAFWRFFEKFYAGVSDLLSVHPRSDANLFSLCEGRVGLAAFNSCYNNDCYAFHGLIRREVIAQSYLTFNDPRHIFDLLIAVWHHSIEGPPYHTDYMDIDIVRGMIGRGFRLGLYGHQHKTQITPQQIWLPDRDRMAVISAGSLSAATKDLPSGVNRQYNILEISPDFRSVYVHVRSMNIANLFSRGYLPEFGGASFAHLDWEPQRNPVGGAINSDATRTRLVVEEAESAKKTNNPSRAVELLLGINLPEGSYERQLLLDAALDAKDWQAIISVTTKPYNIHELVQRVEACIMVHEYTSATDALDNYSKELQLHESMTIELRNRIRAEEAM
jgi:hypothetical protein